MTSLHRAAIAAACVLGLTVGAAPWTAASRTTADDVLQKTRALYAGLTAYADTGVVLNEFGADSSEKHTFITRFNRAPRRFFLDFHKEGGDRFTIWGDPDAYHTYWKTTEQQLDYPNPDNAPAISQSGFNTMQVALKIPPLLYSKAALGGDFNNLADPEVAGNEKIDGHDCVRIQTTARDVYEATGKEVNVRKMTLWIDAQSSVIRKVVEEHRVVAGQRDRVTTSYQPELNPTLAAAKFAFAPETPR